MCINDNRYLIKNQTNLESTCTKLQSTSAASPLAGTSSSDTDQSQLQLPEIHDMAVEEDPGKYLPFVKYMINLLLQFLLKIYNITALVKKVKMRQKQQQVKVKTYKTLRKFTNKNLKPSGC